MKREKRLTKRERKAVERANAPVGATGHTHDHDHQHIHCVACGRHLDEGEFDRGTATVVKCAHGSQFPSCRACTSQTQAMLDEHDRTGQPVREAAAWH
jgi:NAD-dependent SIR2 family protein deacetylase